MTVTRRRVLRPAATPTPADPKSQRHIERLRARLAREQLAYERWQKRLRRAFNAVQKQNRIVIRLQMQLTRLEESAHGPLGR
jgi:hypothetical protein